MKVRGGDIPATSWVSAPALSIAEHFRWGLSMLATLGEEDAVATKDLELSFLVHFLCLAIL